MSRPPAWTAILLRCFAPRDEADDVVGDLQEAHALRLARHGQSTARLLTIVDALDMTRALLRARFTRFWTNKGNGIVQDYKLGLRMLLKYPGLTIAGGLALAIAIGLGAGWYDLSRDLFRPTLPFPGGDRIVEVEMRDAAGSEEERRLLHDFRTWQTDLRSIEELGAYRTLERNLVLGEAGAQAVTVAEITASAFRLAGVPPLIGRPLLDSDEQPGADPVVVLGHRIWQRQFGGRADIVGQTVQLGTTRTTVVGVMPEGFTFPVNHRMWVPLQVHRRAHQPLEGPAIRVFGRIAPDATQAQANVEVSTLTRRIAEASPGTHEHLRPRVLAYGGESPGDSSLVELAVTHLPVLLVLLVACVNVGTLVYARTAMRDAEIATRYALGASRGRIVTQLFVEALVLASVAAVVGLLGASWAIKWGVTAYFSSMPGGMPFWVDPGLRFTTILYAAGLTVVGAALLGVLPALKATGTHVQAQLRNLGSGGSTLRFGGVWTTAMVAQVALTVICLPPAVGISSEAIRDRQIRAQFPAEEYLAVRLGLDQSGGGEANPDARLEQTYAEFERRLLNEPDVRGVTFADRLPGMGPAVMSAEIDVTPGSDPVLAWNLWTADVGPRFFDTFEVALVAGRDFHDGDRAADARTVLVNEAFARRYTRGENPVGRRVRQASGDPAAPQPWFEIVGMVEDIGMTPTDLGEAPYMFRAVSPSTASPLVMAVRVTGDPASVAPRVRMLAAELNADLRLDEVRSLDDHAWRVDVPAMVGAGAIAAVVSLGLFLSAAGIFSLMSVNVARRTREIGLRAALGATQTRLLGGIFARAGILIGSGVAAGNLVLLLFVWLEPELTLGAIYDALLVTSAVMLTVGLLACVEPARRALRIHPIDALKES